MDEDKKEEIIADKAEDAADEMQAADAFAAGSINTEESVSPQEADAKTAVEGASSRRLVIIELVLAAAAILIIVLAIAIKQRNDALTENIAAGEDAGTDTGAGATDAAEEIVIDNSALYTDTPDVPKYTPDASIDYDKLTDEGTMLKLSTSVTPTVYVHNYKNKEYFLKETSVSEDEISAALIKQFLTDFLNEKESVSDTAQLYDSVSINYAGSIDGAAFDGGTADNVELVIGVSSYIDGFTEGIIGMKEGETKDVHVSFPKNYGSAELAGKPAVFSITLNKILHANEIPELTDAIASEASGGEFTTAEELKDYVKKQLRYTLIWDFIDSDYYISGSDEAAILDFYHQTLKQIDEQTTSYQITAEYWISLYYGSDLASFKENLMQQAADTVWRDTLYQAIAENEGIAISDEDIQKLAEDYGSGDDVDGFIESYGEITIKDYLLQNKLMDFFLGLYQ